MSEIIPHWLTKQATLTPDKIAVEKVNGDTLTFFELENKSKDYARKLATAGVQEGDHIGLLSSNRPEMIMIIHALSYLGAVAVLLNNRLSSKELSYQIKNAHISLLLVDEDLRTERVPSDQQVSILLFEELTKLSSKSVPLKETISLKDPFTMMYTSGTTGKPKGVLHTYNHYWWSAISSALNLGLQANDKWLATLPLFHIGGLAIFIRSVIYGIPVLLLRKFSPQIVKEMIHQRNVTIMSVVTVMLQKTIAEMSGQPFPHTFRCMLLGGGPAPVALLEQAKQLKIPVFQSYGLTETSSQIATLSPEDALQKIGSAGKALFPGQLKINKPDQEGIGEIFVKGPMVIDQYYGIPRDELTFQQGWLATGDVGYVDEEGFLYVVDRRSDLIISGGENIYPAEIEDVLYRLEGIEEVGVVGEEDPQWGEVPVAFIVKNNASITKQTIKKHLESHLAAYKRPNKIKFIDALPRNASNKVQRFILQQLLKSEKDDTDE